jgi:hypothetical protein
VAASPLAAASTGDGTNGIAPALITSVPSPTALATKIPPWLVDRLCDVERIEGVIARSNWQLGHAYVAKTNKFFTAADSTADTLDSDDLLVDAMLAAMELQ